MALGGPRFLWNNYWPIGTLTESSEVTGMPAEASQNPERGYVWRSQSSTSDATLAIDLLASYACTCAALADAKLVGAGTVKLQEGGTGGTPGSWNDVATFGAEDPASEVAVVYFNSTSARHWRLYFTNGVPATPDYAEIGYAFLGAYFECSRGAQAPIPFTISDPSSVRSSIDGQKTYATLSKRALGSFAFKLCAEADVTSFRSMFNTLGAGTPWFVTFDTDQGWQQWLAHFTQALTVERDAAPGRYSIALDWEEWL